MNRVELIKFHENIHQLLAPVDNEATLVGLADDLIERVYYFYKTPEDREKFIRFQIMKLESLLSENKKD
jgi:hypothetical protein